MKRGLQRERPPPLQVESKSQIRRLPMAAVQTQALRYRQPIITHIFSPEIIHTEARDFMQLVQRLTGQASHISPLAKKPRHLLQARRVSETVPVLHIPGPMASSLNEQLLDPAMSNLLKSHPGHQSGLSSADLGLSPYTRRGSGAISLISPGGFEFSPSMLPSPTTFLRDFPILLSPYAAGLPSPTLARGVARSPTVMLPAVLRSPGPLTSAFLADLPVLSPAAYKWIEKHPLSAESIISPLPRALGLPPKPPPPLG